MLSSRQVLSTDLYYIYVYFYIYIYIYNRAPIVVHPWVLTLLDLSIIIVRNFFILVIYLSLPSQSHISHILALGTYSRLTSILLLHHEATVITPLTYPLSSLSLYLIALMF